MHQNSRGERLDLAQPVGYPRFGGRNVGNCIPLDRTAAPQLSSSYQLATLNVYTFCDEDACPLRNRISPRRRRYLPVL